MSLYPRLMAILRSAWLIGLFTSAKAFKVQLSPASLTAHVLPGYESWSVTQEEVSSEFHVGNLSLTLKALDDTLNGGRNKIISESVTSYLGQWIVGMGVSSSTTDGNLGLELTIAGLEEGEHSLLTYHNAWDALNAAPTLKITVDGNVLESSYNQTVRANSIWDSAASYLTFNATSGKAVVIAYAPIDGSSTDKRAYLNGLELDVPNISTQPSYPDPEDGDEHIAADNGSYDLTFTPAPNAASYDIYLSTESEAAVESASTDSSEFLGSVDEPRYHLTSISSLKTYWWRVDTILNNGITVAGRVWTFRSRQLAFPGADGFGRYARGGRAGSVLRVTTLEDYIPGDEAPIEGSLRWAIEENTGPRVIIFDVGGVSTLKARLTITDDYITVAGQTAPGKGIVFQGYTLGLSGVHDVIIRHIRVRPGTSSGETIDGMGMRGSNFCIFDRCSISWTIDESFSSRDAYNITLQRTLISEPLNAAGHQNYPAGTQHGYAASIGGNTGTFHHNLLAHAEGRSWSMAGGLDSTGAFNGGLVLVNNVVYNYGDRVTDGGAHQVDFIGNYYKPGPSSTRFYTLQATYEDGFPGTQQYYCEGNMIPGYFDAESTQVVEDTGGNDVVGACYARISIDPAPDYEYFLDRPFFPDSVTYQDAIEAYKIVLSDVGANVPTLDEHDTRIVRETLENTTTYVGSYTGKEGIIDSPDDVGGLEDWPETKRPAWDVDSDGDGVPDWWDGSTGGEGYTTLDGYLNWLADAHIFVAPGEAVDVSLTNLTRGFVEPVFEVTVDKGSVSVANGTATYNAPDEAGIASMFVSLTDNEGSNWDRNVGIGIVDGYERS
ncbi:polysaccharide lyase family 1 protein [Cylindrobasidium torrendii FP15055 ss-10]|uniref:Polysaccharide lyase family 1 protein n=1 Tax=Cylindrobasidium torrendii FP15055 ss-10 TaxID=1314674 RepID=A0A0D7BEG6_9AGAR|nr:polysaccharide lyase family 1 protein [Cylindrobasidium torrendii FP15055 ss-10]